MKKVKRILTFITAVMMLFTVSIGFSGCKDERKNVTVYICGANSGLLELGMEGMNDVYEDLEDIESLRKSEDVWILQAFDVTGAIGIPAGAGSGRPIEPSDIIIPSGVVDNQYTIELNNANTSYAILIRYQIEGSNRLYAFPYDGGPYIGASLEEHKIGLAGGHLEFRYDISYVAYLISEPGRYIFRANINEKHEEFNPLPCKFNELHCEFTIIAEENP